LFFRSNNINRARRRRIPETSFNKEANISFAYRNDTTLRKSGMKKTIPRSLKCDMPLLREQVKTTIRNEKQTTAKNEI